MAEGEQPSEQEWLLLIYRVPPEPTRLRSAVWRRLKSIGAIYPPELRRGRGYEHAIDLPGHGRFTGVFAATRAARGSAVGLQFLPDGCHVFASDY